ncbi:MAG: dTDP-4-dehydrorhamnose 3,5-epimerase family protein [Nanoarchaeota archaeon]
MEIEFKKLKPFIDHEGELFEVLRSDDSIFEGKFGQNLVSIVNPGSIKGLHFHKKQTEYTTCINGTILYVAIKEIKGSSLIKKFQIGVSNRILIKTPPGIWHGYKVLGNSEAIILYTMDKLYNPKDTDTLDRNPYYFGNIWKI